MRIKLVACLCFFVAAVGVRGSDAGTLMDSYNQTQLQTWLHGTALYAGTLRFDLIYDSNDSTHPSSKDFHAAADGQGPTLTLISARPAQEAITPHIIGGLNPQSWSQSGYHSTQALSERTAFIFDLTTRDLRSQRSDVEGIYQTYNDSFFGPNFGGTDITVLADMQRGILRPYSYGTPTTSDFFGIDPRRETDYLVINDVQVFTIAEVAPVPEPSTWAMMLLGICAVGIATYCRRDRAPALAGP